LFRPSGQWELTDTLCSFMGIQRSDCLDKLNFIGARSLGEPTISALQPLFATALAIAFLELALEIEALVNGAASAQAAQLRESVEVCIRRGHEWIAKENSQLGSLAFRFGMTLGWVKFAEEFLVEHSSTSQVQTWPQYNTGLLSIYG